jgi:hypothetical protein
MVRDQYRSTALITFSSKAIGTHLLSIPSMAEALSLSLSLSLSSLSLSLSLYIYIYK